MRPPRIAAFVLALALGLAACSGGDAEEPASATPTQEAVAPTEEAGTPTEQAGAASPSPEASDQASPAQASTGVATEAGSQAASGDVTPPGTQLSIGEAATLDYTYTDDVAGVVAIAPTAIERGDIADLADFDLDAELQASQPYYVRMTITNAGDTNLEFTDPGTQFEAVDDRGTAFSPAILFYGFDRCQHESAPAGFTSGVSYESCLLFLLPQEATVSALRYARFDTPYADGPLVWEQG